ncbi:MAG: TldD/PmbA family protein [Fervidicoccaceae archaeon]
MSEPLRLGEKILSSLREVADEVAVLVLEIDGLMVKLYDGEPSVAQSWRRTSVGLYVGRSGRLAVLFVDSSDPEEVARAASETAREIELLEPSLYGVELPEPERHEPLRDSFDGRVEEVLSEPKKLVELVFGTARAGESGASGMVKAGIVRRALLTSRGFEGEDIRTFFGGYFRIFGEKCSGQWAFTSTKLNEKLLERSLERALELSRLALPRVGVEPGRKTALLSPMVVANLVNYVAGAASALAIDLGFSFLADRSPGDVVASEEFTLIDAPRNADLPNAASFDDEGLATRDKPIIERGTLRSLLHNFRTAAKRGARSTANAGWIEPRPWNLEVAPGDWELEEAVREMREGLIVTNNWYTRIQNAIEGSFSTVTRDALIYVKSGELAGLIERARIVDTLPGLLSKIRGATVERWPIEWWDADIPTLCPYLLVEDVGFTTVD